MAHFGGRAVNLFAILILITSFSDVNGGKARRVQVKDENALMAHLLESFNILVRPAKKPTDTLLVSFGISLHRIVEVDQVYQMLTTSLWQRMEWRDWRLQWDPALYSNISSVKIPIDRLWSPDILPYNNGLQSHSPTFSTNAVARWNGTVTHVAPYRMVTSCDFRPEGDEQNCSLQFGSWSYGASELNLVVGDERGGALSKYIQSNSWEPLDLSAVRTEKKNSWLPEPHVDITYNLKFK